MNLLLPMQVVLVQLNDPAEIQLMKKNQTHQVHKSSDSLKTATKSDIEDHRIEVSSANTFGNLKRFCLKDQSLGQCQ